MILLLGALCLVILYAVIQFQYIWYWRRIQDWGAPHSQLTPVSIVVVVRNGAGTIEACIHGILHQHYPAHLVELIVVDDHSTDDTAARVWRFTDTRIRFHQLQHHPEYIHSPAFKKSGIALAVDRAANDLIIVTDADCLHLPNWLRTIVQHFEESNAVFQTAPVLLLPGNTWLLRMQEMEITALMLITGSGIHSGLHDMANGANMAFSKKAFLQTGGYQENYQYHSGDDMFLIEQMRKAYPDQIAFAKSIEAVVLTSGQAQWSSLIRQRLRWSKKNEALSNSRIRWIWWIVGAYHIVLLLLFVLSVLSILSWWPFMIMVTSKWIADLALLYQATVFFKKESLLRYFIPLQFMYGMYILRMGWAMITGQKGDWRR